MEFLDIYLGSKELKKLIVDRSTRFELPLRYICSYAKIDYKEFMQNYINSLENNEATLTEKQFNDIFEILGIATRFQFVVKKDENYNANEMRKMITEHYNEHQKA
jgi:hypothetical protein